MKHPLDSKRPLSLNARCASRTLCAPYPERPVHARSRERGAVLFIVLMGMLLLTSLGTWVVYAGGIASSTSGYQRSASQTLYLSELAVLTGTSYMAQPGMARDGYEVMEQTRAGGSPDSCQSVPNQTNADKCKRYGVQEFNSLIVATGNASGYSLLDLTGGGSFSPYATTQEGDFIIEFSDHRGAYVQGNDTSNKDLYQNTTITSYARLRPYSANICAGAAGANSAATQVGMRAYSVIGPMR